MEKLAHEMILEECEKVVGPYRKGVMRFDGFYQVGRSCFRFNTNNKGDRLLAARRAVNDHRWVTVHYNG